MSEPLLSKSKYLVGLQCPKLLWHHYNAREKLPPIDEGTQALFDQGHEVGLLARKLFPGGSAVEWGASFSEMIAQSLSLLGKRRPIFEAGYAFDNCFARVDVLKPAPGGAWDIIEVKSGTSVKDPNWDDVAFQRYCCKNAGVPIRACHVMHVDSTYLRRGEVDPGKLFTSEDVTGTVDEKTDGLESRTRELFRVIGLKKWPATPIGPYCDAPYTCPLKPDCWKRVDAGRNSVFTLHRLGQKAWGLYRDGIIRNEQILPGFKLSKRQQIQLETERNRKPHVNRPAVVKFLAKLQYPLHLLDFETFQTAIPRLEGTRPWQQVPFQFSLHVASSIDAEPVHHSWLWAGKGDPRKQLLERLSPLLGDRGSVVVYNASFETSRLRECVDAYPALEDWLEGILDRIADLLDPFKSFDVYYPGQHGSASLKQVLPALTGNDYSGLAIREGGQASEAFKRVTFGDVGEKERREIRRHLEDYCGMDTMSMLDIIDVLRRHANAPRISPARRDTV